MWRMVRTGREGTLCDGEQASAILAQHLRATRQACNNFEADQDEAKRKGSKLRLGNKRFGCLGFLFLVAHRLPWGCVLFGCARLCSALAPRHVRVRVAIRWNKKYIMSLSAIREKKSMNLYNTTNSSVILLSLPTHSFRCDSQAASAAAQIGEKSGAS